MTELPEENRMPTFVPEITDDAPERPEDKGFATTRMALECGYWNCCFLYLGIFASDWHFLSWRTAVVILAFAVVFVLLHLFFASPSGSSFVDAYLNWFRSGLINVARFVFIGFFGPILAILGFVVLTLIDADRNFWDSINESLPGLLAIGSLYLWITFLACELWRYDKMRRRRTTTQQPVFGSPFTNASAIHVPDAPAPENRIAQ